MPKSAKNKVKPKGVINPQNYNLNEFFTRSKSERLVFLQKVWE